MSFFHNSALAGASGQSTGGYQIERSLRFNSSDSAYLSRTPASAGNRKTWTWSGWVKRSSFNSELPVLIAFTSVSDRIFCGYITGDIFQIFSPNGGGINLTTSAVYRDPSAWYHLVISFDTTQATASGRVRFYINGIEQALSGTFPGQNTDWPLNSTVAHYLGFVGTTLYFNGYLADIHFIDGQALDPTSFAETNADTGQWVPKAYTGTYGTNGFHLPLSDNSAATATTLGKDTSGNGNNWTPNNLSVTAGAGNDSLVDTPTSYGTDTGAGGEVRGNYATINPLAPSGGTFSNGNLDWASPTTDQRIALSTISISTPGKWYCEYTIGSKTGNFWGVGIFGNPASWSPRRMYRSDGAIFDDSSQIATYGSFTQGDVMGLAFDSSTSSVSFYKNGALQGSLTASPSASAAKYYFGCTSDSSGGSMNYSANFGQRPFAYTAPSGFKALCDTNLPAPVVAKPNEVMDVKLYTGNGSTQTISGLGFSPDLVWGKNRNGTYSPTVQDTVRGAGKTIIYTNQTVAENAYNEDWISAFNSDGFTMPNGFYNESARTYVAWCWDAGSSTTTNNSGSISSQVRANPSAGFSIVTYTGTSSSQSVGHGLNVAPSLIITKNRSAALSWGVYHSSLGANSYLVLDVPNAVDSASGIWGTVNSSVFGINNFNINGRSNPYVAYCFAPVAGYSSFGSYTGNGSADGPFVYTGFRPRWILTKASSTADVWTAIDTARSPFNAAKENIFVNQSSAENSATAGLDILSNGFKPRNQFNYNGSGVTYIYAAFAENPFQYARAR